MNRQRPAADRHQRVVAALLERHGRTYAEQAGITLADEPAPLYQLLVLTTLLSHRISADLAVAGARALFGSGYRTPAKMQATTRGQRVAALGRGRFRRYDESTATTLGEMAAVVLDRWGGDLRRLRDDGHSDPAQLEKLLMQFKGIGPTGSGIFLREVQGVWPGIAPYLDAKMVAGAKLLELPEDGDLLAELAGSPLEMARLASALVRASRDPNVVRDVVGGG